MVGALIIGGAVIWYRRKHPKPQVTRAGEVVDLEVVSGGVVRAEDENGDHPPKYARVGKPGEVPPGYDGSRNSTSREVSAESADPMPSTTTSDVVAPTPKKRGFWRLIWPSTHR